ncbi:hypothetical protein VIGAN_11121400 [Vigna angularis var. angularis]|uniref:Uncharacterized protein n=1 Tax=Vigna angularis var. angularis TaxID=157739 RepID=A0A0S3TA74_PHAAN|nr:hypothetical protein VIGAN_11121400 [Vigna angularis var. angularis]
MQIAKSKLHSMINSKNKTFQPLTKFKGTENVFSFHFPILRDNSVQNKNKASMSVNNFVTVHKQSKNRESAFHSFWRSWPPLCFLLFHLLKMFKQKPIMKVAAGLHQKNIQKPSLRKTSGKWRLLLSSKDKMSSFKMEED